MCVAMVKDILIYKNIALCHVLVHVPARGGRF